MGSREAMAFGDGRVACAFCAERIAPEARICHHCHSTALVDVLVAAAGVDPRLRYQIARGISALPDAPPLLVVQAGLDRQPARAAIAVTQARAREVVALLAGHGVGARVVPETAVDIAGSSSSGGFRWLAAAGAAIAVLIVCVLLLRSSTRPTAGPSLPRAAASEERPAPVERIAPADVGERAAAPAPAFNGRALARQSIPSTVSLRCRSSIGSGFFVTPDLVLTNAHVLCPGGEPMQVVLSDGRKLVGTTEKAGEGVDLGLVRVANAQERPLPLGDVGDLAPGDKVAIIGSPMGLEFTVQEGSVSSLQRAVRGIALVQLDAKINPGNSGGPVIDASGRVVAVVTLKHSAAEGIGLALPINYAYDASVGMVEPPSGTAAASPAFARMVAEAASRPGSETPAGGSGAGPGGTGRVDDRPVLASVAIDAYDRLVVGVLRAGAAPAYEEVTVKVWQRTDNFCTVKGDITSWKDMPVASVVPPATASALRAQGIERLFLGEAALRFDLCNRAQMVRGIELELEGGQPGANRMVLR